MSKFFNRAIMLKDSSLKLYPHVRPSWQNIYRTTALTTTIFLVPISTLIIPFVFADNNSSDDSSQSNMNHEILTSLGSVVLIAFFSSAQKALIDMLMVSITQSMKQKNTELVMNSEVNLLLNGDLSDVTSLQLVSVGMGVRHFVISSVPVLVQLPMNILSISFALINIGIISKSITVSAVSFAFVAASFILLYLTSSKFYALEASYQKIENELIPMINFVEANRDSIALMHAQKLETKAIIKHLRKINPTIPKMTLLSLINSEVLAVTTAIASQFIGGYFKYAEIVSLNSTTAKTLNVILILLMSSVQNMVKVITSDYEYIKVNYDQLIAFEDAYEKCQSLNLLNNIKLSYQGDKLIIKNLSLYKSTNTHDIIVKDVNFELDKNKIYYLGGDSGCGKTSFLKGIIGCWQFSEGNVQWPELAENKIYFLPHNNILPDKTLIEIMCYPFTVMDFIREHLNIQDNEMLANDMNNIDDNQPLLFLSEQQGSNSQLVDLIIEHLSKFDLLPSSIKEDEIEQTNINWQNRLSAGEKQKLCIIRMLLTKPKFIIMDEATSALDKNNKKKVMNIIKDDLDNSIEDYILIYTEHAPLDDFKDFSLLIDNHNIDFYQYC